MKDQIKPSERVCDTNLQKLIRSFNLWFYKNKKFNTLRIGGGF